MDSGLSDDPSHFFIMQSFSNWEPHIDCASVLMALLEHTIDYQILEDQFRDKIILSSQAELCRAAHKALCQIAKSRASTFIITIGKFSTG